MGIGFAIGDNDFDKSSGPDVQIPSIIIELEGSLPAGRGVLGTNNISTVEIQVTISIKKLPITLCVKRLCLPNGLILKINPETQFLVIVTL